LVQSFSETTEVYFRPLTIEQIQHYITNYKPFDKAGSYAIQEWIGMVGIEKIVGDYYNVMGLPIGEVVKRLEFGF
jgi:septum formation protein